MPRKKSPGPAPTIREVARGFAASSPFAVYRIVANYVAAELGHLAPQQLTPLMLGAITARWKANLRPNTVAVYTHTLRKLGHELHRAGAPPIPIAQPIRGKQRAIIATPDELARLFTNPEPWMRLFLQLYFQCGLRLSETLAVTPRSWNREEQTITVPVKGHGTRTVSIGPDTQALLTAAGDPPTDMPFLHALRGGKPISVGRIHNAWRQYCRKCNVSEKVTAHDLRRTAATILYTATHDLRAAQQLLGHKNLASTLAYLAPLHPDDARKYAELLRFQRFHSEVKQ